MEEYQQELRDIDDQFSFADDLWDKFDLLCKVSTEKRKYFEDLINIFEEITNIDESYAKSFEKIDSKVSAINYKGTLAHAIQTLRFSFQNKIELARNYSKNLKNEVIQNLKDTIKIQNNDAKNSILDGKKLEKDYKKILENLEKVAL